MRTSYVPLLVFLVIIRVLGLAHGAATLSMNFYQKSCPEAEAIIKKVTWAHVSSNPQLPAKFLRLQAHDCFVRGCDASVLLDSPPNAQEKDKAEKDAPPNKHLAGYDVIELAKAQLEKTCPGVVSCADIVALASRDSVSFQFHRSLWEVPTGRRDGTVSLQQEALAQLPDPSSNFTTLQKNFADKGININDLVVLSGAHTLGVGHCFLFKNRLYNFTGKGDTDPSIDPTYAELLKKKCLNQRDFKTTIDMDESPLTFDNNYYKILKQNKGMFTGDATLLTNPEASKIVDKMLDSKTFFTEFAQSMQRFGAIGVLTGDEGQIRKKCNVVNA
ncbi:hypothetical protein AQUCO_02600115v1 [Aquilegia coerulea]|uniref:Peroxidase n=1 Tax=Aquilegia coerulea TaxID=218851 RepID=A0A2G5D7H4_AQUCA|nr:hypothetical protein AQUCO_02600115v1 [Aquilegia coerulea]